MRLQGYLYCVVSVLSYGHFYLFQTNTIATATAAAVIMQQQAAIMAAGQQPIPGAHTQEPQPIPAPQLGMPVPQPIPASQLGTPVPQPIPASQLGTPVPQPIPAPQLGTPVPQPIPASQLGPEIINREPIFLSQSVAGSINGEVQAMVTGKVFKSTPILETVTDMDKSEQERKSIAQEHVDTKKQHAILMPDSVVEVTKSGSKLPDADQREATGTSEITKREPATVLQSEKELPISERELGTLSDTQSTPNSESGADVTKNEPQAPVSESETEPKSTSITETTVTTKQQQSTSAATKTEPSPVTLTGTESKNSQQQKAVKIDEKQQVTNISRSILKVTQGKTVPASDTKSDSDELYEPNTSTTYSSTSDFQSKGQTVSQAVGVVPKTTEAQTKVTYKSGPVRYTYNDQTKNNYSTQQSEQQQSEQQQQHTEQQHMQQQDELQQHMEQVYNTPKDYEECRMQMTLAATLTQLPPDMTIGDLYQYINPNILESMNLPPAPGGIIMEKLVEQQQQNVQLPDVESGYHPAKYEEVIAKSAQKKLRKAQEKEITSLLELSTGNCGDVRQEKGKCGLGGGHVSMQRMDMNYTVAEGEYVGPQVPAHLKHPGRKHDVRDLRHQSFDIQSERGDMIDDEFEEYVAFEDGEVVDDQHGKHQRGQTEERSRRHMAHNKRSDEKDERSEHKRSMIHGRSDPLGFNDGHVISNDISDFHRRLLRMSGSLGDEEEHRTSAYSTGLQYRLSGDTRPPYVRNIPNRYKADMVPGNWASREPPGPPNPLVEASSTDPKKEKLPDSVMQFVRPKYHEEGYSER